MPGERATIAVILARGPLRAVEAAAVSFDDDGEPYAEDYGDSYFSRENGVAESRHVFLDGNRVAQRLNGLGRPFTIGELGFGTGLNFLLTLQALRAWGTIDQRLHYWSVDAHPLSTSDLFRAHERWPELEREARELQAVYPPPVPGVHRRHFDNGRVILDMVWADAGDAIDELVSLERPLVDAWYLDGFAPSRNGAMWTPEILQGLASASRDGATVATFTVAGTVRRGLQSAGFSIEKRPGYGRKRECLSGSLETRRPIVATSTPWDLPANELAAAPASVSIIGAGLAGAALAAALARRGCHVTVFEADRIAARASGNPQGVLFNRLSPQRSALSDFSLHANLFAAAAYKQMFRGNALRRRIDGELNGCLQVGAQATRVSAEQLVGLPEVARLLDTADASSRLGSAIPSGGLWQPASGWLSPPAVCRALLDHPLITLREECGPMAYQRDGDHWSVNDAAGAPLAATDMLLVAAGTGSRSLTSERRLPLRSVRGQTTQIPAPADGTLGASFCHDGYIAPALAGEHCIGSTFQPKDEDCSVRISDHRQNIEKLAAALPAWAPYLENLNPEDLRGRAELRCVSPDYLPLVGPLPAVESFRNTYQALAYDASQCVPERADYEPGLSMSTAHGSRGLSYTALGAELIASQLFAEPLPVSREIQQALSPARFLLRGIIRGTTQCVAMLAVTLAFALLEPEAVAQEASSGAQTTTPAAAAQPVSSYGYEVLERLPMDRGNFIQGLQIVGNTLYVGTGQYGESRLREYDFPAMTLRRQVELSEELFGEGVVRLDGKVFQLTWLSGKLLVYDAQSLELLKTGSITTQGWGITHNGKQLIYSDGSHRLRFIDPETLQETGYLDVMLQGQRLARLNELEWIDGEIWANVWMSNQLVRIDPGTGTVTAIVDLRGLLAPEDRQEDTDVLNGIAWDSQERAIWVTGKRWPWLYRIRPVRLPGP